MQGFIEKMHTRLTEEFVEYSLPLSKQTVALNPLLGKNVQLRYTGAISCIHCGRKTTKSFNQGYCYPCFATLAQCDMCIMKPETCHYAQGTCREHGMGGSVLFSAALCISSQFFWHQGRHHPPNANSHPLDRPRRDASLADFKSLLSADFWPG